MPEGVALIFGGEEENEKVQWERKEDGEEFMLSLCEVKDRVQEMVDEALSGEGIYIDDLRDVQINIWTIMSMLIQVYQLTYKAQNYISEECVKCSGGC